MTECHRLGGLNDRNLFLTVLVTRKSKVKVSVDLETDEGSLPDLQIACIYMLSAIYICYLLYIYMVSYIYMCVLTWWKTKREEATVLFLLIRD